MICNLFNFFPQSAQPVAKGGLYMCGLDNVYVM